MTRWFTIVFALMLTGSLVAQSLSSFPDTPLLWVPSQDLLLPSSLGTDAAFAHPTAGVGEVLGDSLYLIRPERYRFYQRLHRYMADTAQYSAGASLLASYRGSLLRTQTAYDRLLRDYRSANSLSTHTLNTTRVTLHQLQQTLKRTETRLEASEQALHTVEEQAKAQRRRSFFRGLAYGSGLGASLVVLLLMAGR